MKEFDVVIIGGGINGCGLLRDLALNGVKALLLEKGDFSSQTSQGSSKMLHGGVRYLENFDFALVQEALEEKNLWLRLAPHVCFEREFYVPLFKFSKYRPWMLGIGLFLYDFLSHFQNKPFAVLGKKKTIEAIPSIKTDGLLGAGKYFDGVVDDAKLALECLYDALLEPGVEALSYHEVTKVDGHEVTYLDRLSGKSSTVRGKIIVYSTGPFTDKLLPKLGILWTPKLVPSKGVHLWLKPGTVETSGSVVLTTKDNRVVFVIPQRDAILLGTTETPVEQDMFDIQATERDVDYLLGVLKEFFPGANADKSQIISSFAAVRPLVREEGSNESLGKVSRFHKIFRPNAYSYVILGGKYTTFRRMCQELAQEIVPRLGRIYNPNETMKPLRQKSLVPTFGRKPEVNLDLIKKIIKDERVATYEDLVKRRLSLLDNDPSTIMGVPSNEVKSLFAP